MKTEYLKAKILGHRGNLRRYRSLLQTHLTELEREYLHRRVAEERTEVARLELVLASTPRPNAESISANSPLPQLSAVACLRVRSTRTATEDRTKIGPTSRCRGG